MHLRVKNLNLDNLTHDFSLKKSSPCCYHDPPAKGKFKPSYGHSLKLGSNWKCLQTNTKNDINKPMSSQYRKKEMVFIEKVKRREFSNLSHLKKNKIKTFLQQPINRFYHPFSCILKINHLMHNVLKWLHTV